MKPHLALAVFAVVVSPTMAQAQTAYGSPTAPTPHGLPGTPPLISRTAPSDGSPSQDDLGVTPPGSGQTFGALSPQPAPEFEREQKRIDRETVICTRCD